MFDHSLIDHSQITAPQEQQPILYGCQLLAAAEIAKQQLHDQPAALEQIEKELSAAFQNIYAVLLRTPAKLSAAQKQANLQATTLTPHPKFLPTLTWNDDAIAARNYLFALTYNSFIEHFHFLRTVRRSTLPLPMHLGTQPTLVCRGKELFVYAPEALQGKPKLPLERITLNYNVLVVNYLKELDDSIEALATEIEKRKDAIGKVVDETLQALSSRLPQQLVEQNYNEYQFSQVTLSTLCDEACQPDSTPTTQKQHANLGLLEIILSKLDEKNELIAGALRQISTKSRQDLEYRKRLLQIRQSNTQLHTLVNDAFLKICKPKGELKAFETTRQSLILEIQKIIAMRKYGSGYCEQQFDTTSLDSLGHVPNASSLDESVHGGDHDGEPLTELQKQDKKSALPLLYTTLATQLDFLTAPADYLWNSFGARLQQVFRENQFSPCVQWLLGATPQMISDEFTNSSLKKILDQTPSPDQGQASSAQGTVSTPAQTIISSTLQQQLAVSAALINEAAAEIRMSKDGPILFGVTLCQREHAVYPRQTHSSQPLTPPAARTKKHSETQAETSPKRQSVPTIKTDNQKTNITLLLIYQKIFTSQPGELDSYLANLDRAVEEDKGKKEKDRKLALDYETRKDPQTFFLQSMLNCFLDDLQLNYMKNPHKFDEFVAPHPIHPFFKVLQRYACTYSKDGRPTRYNVRDKIQNEIIGAIQNHIKFELSHNPQCNPVLLGISLLIRTDQERQPTETQLHPAILEENKIIMQQIYTVLIQMPQERMLACLRELEEKIAQDPGFALDPNDPQCPQSLFWSKMKHCFLDDVRQNHQIAHERFDPFIEAARSASQDPTSKPPFFMVLERYGEAFRTYKHVEFPWDTEIQQAMSGALSEVGTPCGGRARLMTFTAGSEAAQPPASPQPPVRPARHVGSEPTSIPGTPVTPYSPQGSVKVKVGARARLQFGPSGVATQPPATPTAAAAASSGTPGSAGPAHTPSPTGNGSST